VLGEPIIAPSDMPHCATAAMDGYACRQADVEALGALEIEGTIAAGDAGGVALSPERCIKIFTGAAMPIGADMLIPVEYVEVKEGRITLGRAAPRIGQFIRNRGDNYKAGEQLLGVGTRIGPAEIALLASLNVVFVEVVTQPIITILSSGNELAEVGESCKEPHALRSANNHLLASMVRALGGIARLRPILRDDKRAIRIALKEALEQSDMVLTTGGMSMGDYDFTQDVVQELCDEIVFKGVRIKPGRPIMYAKKGTTHLFGLPGFPNSCAVTFTLFAKVVLQRFLGISSSLVWLRAKLLEDAPKDESRMEFRTCSVRLLDGELVVDFAGKKGIQSAIINNLCGATALLMIEEESQGLRAGEMVRIVLMNPFEQTF